MVIKIGSKLHNYTIARRISAAVLDVLLPVIKEIKDDINTLNELYSNMSQVVGDLEECVEEHKNHTSSELADLRALLQSHIDGHPTTDVVANSVLLKLLPYLNNMEDELNDRIDESANSLAADLTDIKVKVCDLNETVGETVKQHKSQTSSELADLRALLQSHIDGHPTTDVVGNTVLLKLLPYLNNMEDELNDRIDESANSLAADLTDIKVKVCDLNETVGETVKQHKSQTSSELADLRALLQSHIDGHPTTDVVANSVLLRVLPYLNIMEDDVFDKIDESAIGLAADFHNDLSSLKDSVTDIKVKVCDLNETVEEHRSQTSSTLAGLCEKVDDSLCWDFQDGLSSLNESVTALNELQINHDSNIYSKLDSLDSKQDQLSMIVMSVASELEENILSNVTEELKQTSDSLLDSLGYYICGGEGGWRRVVYLDMTDPTTSCPSGWQLTHHSKRSCGKVSSGSLTCNSAFFPVTGGPYTRVCGKIIGYQNGITDAFEAYDDGLVTTIYGAYVSGVSLTHGSPGSRAHIWTFAAGVAEDLPTLNDVCPCDATISIAIPPFVGGDYFCESGVNSGSFTGFHPDDPLWDGQGCTSNSTCCSFNNPPYFTKHLSNPTTDDIEARICQKDYRGDSSIEFIELYVK